MGKKYKVVVRDLDEALKFLAVPELLTRSGRESGLTAEQTSEIWGRIDRAILKLKGLRMYLAISPASLLGSEGGKRLAKLRGPEYFRELQARRKTHAGGRPAKKKG